jgi:hypothetical protein
VTSNIWSKTNNLDFNLVDIRFESQLRYSLSCRRRSVVFRFIQENERILHALGYSQFLPNPFQFIIHLSSYHPVLYNLDIEEIVGAPGNVVGWGTMLQAGRSQVQFLIKPLEFFNWPKPSSRTMVLESTQSGTEMSIRNLPGGKGRPARKADNFTAICEPIV